MPLFTSGGLGLGLVMLVLVLGLKNLVLFTSLENADAFSPCIDLQSCPSLRGVTTGWTRVDLLTYLLTRPLHLCQKVFLGLMQIRGVFFFRGGDGGGGMSSLKFVSLRYINSRLSRLSTTHFRPVDHPTLIATSRRLLRAGLRRCRWPSSAVSHSPINWLHHVFVAARLVLHCAFASAGPAVWNSLPEFLRDPVSTWPKNVIVYSAVVTSLLAF